MLSRGDWCRRLSTGPSNNDDTPNCCCLALISKTLEHGDQTKEQLNVPTFWKLLSAFFILSVPSPYVFCECISVQIYKRLHRSIHPSGCPSVHPSTPNPSICLSIYLPINLSRFISTFEDRHHFIYICMCVIMHIA